MVEAILPSWQDFLLMTPELLVLITGALILLLTPFVEPGSKRTTPYLAFFGTLLALASCFVYDANTMTSLMNNMFVVDGFSIFFKIVFLIVCALIILLSLRYLEDESANMGEYYSMIMFSTLGMMLMAGCNDLIGIYLALELMAVTNYILAGYYRRYAESNEAAIKYYLTGIVASAFMLYGVAMIYGVTGTTELHAIAKFLAAGGGVGNPAVALGMILLVVGFGFKIAAVPFHMWLPDVYQGAPTCVTAFMSVGPKAAAFAAIIRVFYIGLAPMRADWALLFGVISAMTMTTGTILAVVQKSLKRMLAYSSIAHAGYILLGMTVVGTDFEAIGLSAILFYLFSYIFMNIGAFGILILLRKEALTAEDMDHLNGLAQRAPFIAFIMLVFMLSQAGIPPTFGFVGKMYIFGAVIRVAQSSGSYFYGILAVIAVLNAAISAFYYLRVIMNMYLKEGDTVLEWHYSHSLMFVILVSAMATILFGLFPGGVLTMARQSVSMIL